MCVSVCLCLCICVSVHACVCVHACVRACVRMHVCSTSSYCCCHLYQFQLSIQEKVGQEMVQVPWWTAVANKSTAWSLPMSGLQPFVPQQRRPICWQLHQSYTSYGQCKPGLSCDILRRNNSPGPLQQLWPLLQKEGWTSWTQLSLSSTPPKLCRSQGLFHSIVQDAGRVFILNKILEDSRSSAPILKLERTFVLLSSSCSFSALFIYKW